MVIQLGLCQPGAPWCRGHRAQRGRALPHLPAPQAVPVCSFPRPGELSPAWSSHPWKPQSPEANMEQGGRPRAAGLQSPILSSQAGPVHSHGRGLREVPTHFLELLGGRPGDSSAVTSDVGVPQTPETWRLQGDTAPFSSCQSLPYPCIPFLEFPECGCPRPLPWSLANSVVSVTSPRS